jgi:hypothetical protein
LSKLKHIKNWYELNEKRVSTFSLISGFLFDSFALHRIDSLGVNAWLLFNLGVVLVTIVLVSREESVEYKHDSWKHFWLFVAMQFGFGAVLGGSFRFYLRSGSIAGSWPFLVILLGSMLANEFLKKHYVRLVFRLSFLYLSIFVLLIFMIPLAVHRIGTPIFLLSGAVSLLIFHIYTKILKKFGREKSLGDTRDVWLAVLSIFLFLNLLYVTNLIPPLPLSLTDAGVYHSISVDNQGSYHVTSEKKGGWSEYLELTEQIHLIKGEPLYAYAAIFAPASIYTQIIHEWQHKNEFGEWVTATRIPLTLSGGRLQGFRTYSEKSSLSPGEWRVNIKTPKGQLIGRTRFEIVEATVSPEYVTHVKN